MTLKPALLPGAFAPAGLARRRPLVRDSLFTAEVWQLEAGRPLQLAQDRLQILGVLSGPLSVRSGGTSLSLAAGQFCLLPASLPEVELRTKTAATFLRVETGIPLPPASHRG